MGEAKAKKDHRAAARSSRTQRQKIFESARAATVAFGVHGDGEFKILGSGIVVDRTGTIVTARHVLDGVDSAVLAARRVEKQLKPGIFAMGPAVYQYDVQNDKHEVSFEYKELVALGMMASKTHDIAVVRVRSTEPLPFLPVDYDADPREGDEIATCGFPYGVEMHGKATILSSFLVGTVSAVVPHPSMPPAARMHYMLELPVNPGNSGGAVFDPVTGCVIGIISRRYQPGGIPAGLCVAETIHHARDAIQKVRLEAPRVSP